MSGRVIDSLWVRLGFSVDHHKLAAFKSQVDGIKHSVQGMAALIGVQAVRQVAHFIERTIQGAAAINDFADVVGVAREEVDTLIRAGIEASTSADGMKNSIRGVADATGQAAMGLGRSVKLFKMLGLNAKDSNGNVRGTVDVMAELAEKFSKMSAAQRVTVATRFRIDENLAATMASLGGAGFRKFIDDARGGGVLREEDFIAADRTSKAFERMKKLTSDLVALIGIRLGPYVERLTKAAQGWWMANRESVLEGVEKGFAALGKAIKFVAGIVTGFVKVGSSAVDVLKKLGIATWVFYGAAIALAAIKLGAWALGVAAAVTKLNAGLLLTSLHMLKIGLAVAVAYLALQDLATFFRGGDSLIGRFVEFTDGLEGARTALLGIALAVAYLMGPLSIALVGILAWSIAIKDLGDNWNVVKNWFLDGWSSITKAVDDAWSKVKDFAAWILDSPAGKALRWALVNVLGADDTGTSAWIEGQNQDHNDRASKQQNLDASNPLNGGSMAPSYFEGGQGVWRMRGGTNVRNDNAVHLNIGKIVSERPEDVPRIMAGQVNPMLRDAQSPVRL